MRLAQSILNVIVGLSEDKAVAMKDHVQLPNKDVFGSDASKVGSQNKNQYMCAEDDGAHRHVLYKTAPNRLLCFP